MKILQCAKCNIWQKKKKKNSLSFIISKEANMACLSEICMMFKEGNILNRGSQQFVVQVYGWFGNLK